MKISKITIENFRAYREPFELDLEGGKNLLLYGENGAGKSSLYFALKRFFEERGGSISDNRNHFTDPTKPSSVCVHLKGSDSTGADYDQDVLWNNNDGHPLSVPTGLTVTSITNDLRSLLVDASRRSGFLDYKTMLKTNLLAKPISRATHHEVVHELIYGDDSVGLEEQFFDVATWCILDGVRVTIDRGEESTIGSLIRRVWKYRPRDRYKKSLLGAHYAVTAFNQAFAVVLPELERKVSEFLDYFDKHNLTVKFAPVSLYWDKKTLALKGATLIPEIMFRNKPFAKHHLNLNEARLSALAICMFLAGVLLSDNDYANPAHPRFLFLDDALIGLELQNRLPILRILQREEFKHYQVFLLTHDRVWFDLARGHLAVESGWLHRELLADEDTGILIPRCKSSQSDIQRSRAHLANGDLMAGAVYARAALEWKLRNICEGQGIKVKFKKDNKEISADDLWNGILGRQKERVEMRRTTNPNARDFIPDQLVRDVEAMRSTVLNQLSHAGAPGLVKADVEDALKTVEALEIHGFPRP